MPDVQYMGWATLVAIAVGLGLMGLPRVSLKWRLRGAGIVLLAHAVIPWLLPYLDKR